ncbi:MAG: lipid-A-disaccharide synthase [Rhodospirillaceae bacterium]|nr:lipid-A-disaccharide synthase [Rhodospirillaceae bacterium]
MKEILNQSGNQSLVYIIAGEVSGDALGAALIRELRKKSKGKIEFVGIGGDQMEAEGVNSLFPISEMAVMGIFELLPHVPRLMKRIEQTVADVLCKNPAALITIDSKAFTMRVAKRIYKRQSGVKERIRLIHMVAPTVWAWRPRRAKQIAKFLDHLLTLFPFEPPYFTKHGLKTTFVGHPASEQPEGNGAGYRQLFNIEEKMKVVTLLPGSRPGEVSRLLPIFGKTIELLHKRYSNLHIAIPTVSSVEELVRRKTSSWAFPISITTGIDQKLGAFSASSIALAASGTITLELAIAKVPTVVAYRVNPFTVPIASLLVDLSSVVLPNRLLEKKVFPLFLQWQCKPESLFLEMCRQLDSPCGHKKLAEVGTDIRKSLRASDKPGAAFAADTVFSELSDL